MHSPISFLGPCNKLFSAPNSCFGLFGLTAHPAHKLGFDNRTVIQVWHLVFAHKLLPSFFPFFPPVMCQHDAKYLGSGSVRFRIWSHKALSSREITCTTTNRMPRCFISVTLVKIIKMMTMFPANWQWARPSPRASHLTLTTTLRNGCCCNHHSTQEAEAQSPKADREWAWGARVMGGHKSNGWIWRGQRRPHGIGDDAWSFEGGADSRHSRQSEQQAERGVDGWLETFWVERHWALIYTIRTYSQRCRLHRALCSTRDEVGRLEKRLF